MENSTLLLGAVIAIVIAAASYFLGRRTVAGATTWTADTSAGASAIEIARLQEREKSLIAEIARKDGEFKSLADTLDCLHKEHAGSREKLAAAEEKAIGLQGALSHEREINDA